jgi:hypothetical protein
MAVSPVNFQQDGFGTLAQLLAASGGGIGFDTAAITTTNAVPSVLYTKMVSPSTTMALRITVVTTSNSGVITGKFVREFTVSRILSGSATLVQELIPSPDYQIIPDLAVNCSVDSTNAIVLVTGMPGTVIWHSLIEVIS